MIVAFVVVLAAVLAAAMAVFRLNAVCHAERGEKHHTRRSQGTDGVAPNGGSGENLRGRIGYYVDS